MNQGVKDLSLFLWKDVYPMVNMMLPPNSPFCQDQHILMRRDKVVKKVKEVIAKIPSHLPNSVFLSGFEGSGKTTLLKLLASSLTSDGCDVYFLNDAKNIPKNIHYSFKLLLEDNTQKVAILIDDSDNFKLSSLFSTVLKIPMSHLVTIGVAATNYNRSFSSSLEVSDLALHEDEEDFKKLVQHCVKLNATSPEVTHFICHYLLKQCRGHIYPTLALVDHFFICEDTKQYVVSADVFLRFFCGPDFSLTPVHDTIVRTCFPQLLKDETRKAAQLVLGGGRNKFPTVDSFWCNVGRSDCVSPFLLNAVLSGASNKEQQEKARADQVLSLDATKSPEENTDLVIAAGVTAMERSDLMEADRDNTFHDTNVIAFNWARSARTRVVCILMNLRLLDCFRGAKILVGAPPLKFLGALSLLKLNVTWRHSVQMRTSMAIGRDVRCLTLCLLTGTAQEIRSPCQGMRRLMTRCTRLSMPTINCFAATSSFAQMQCPTCTRLRSVGTPLLR